MGMPCNVIFSGEPLEYSRSFSLGVTVTALSGKYEEMQYNEVGDFDETPDVSELEALKRSTGVRPSTQLALLLVLAVL